MKLLLSFLCLFTGAILSSVAATVGATTPFTSFEAEAGQVAGGAVIRTMTELPKEKSSPEKEASGRAFVELKGTGQSVTWTNTTGKNFTAINIRFSIPDAPEGGGTTSTLDLYVNGQFRQALTLNSAQCWLYRNNGTKTPSAGSPYKYFDEAHFFITGAAVYPGSTISLQQDQTNTAAFYWIDVVDLENPPAPIKQPDNSVSITDFGAVADDKTQDSTKAIQKCFDAAHEQNKIAWIPPGTFYMNTAGGLHAKDITMEGAGAWYSKIYRNCPLPSPKGVGDMIQPVSCTVRGFSVDQNAPARDGPNGDGGGINIKGNGWLVDSVWVQHTSSGVWGDGSNGVVKNCRMDSTWGDGINLNNGNSGNDGNDLTAENNFVRGTGDDCLAINSDKSSHLMNRITFINNTSVAPWEANGLGIYGGKDIVVKNNLIQDAGTECGLSVGVFGNQGSELESGVVEGNVIYRSGDRDHAGLGIGTHNEINSIANVYVANNTVIDSITRGVSLRKGVNVVVQNNHVEGGNFNKPGFIIEPWAAGSGILNGNTAVNVSSGDPATLESTAQYTIIRPTLAVSVNNGAGTLSRGPCSEGGEDLTTISDGNWSLYSGIELGANSNFIARVASADTGGTISIYLDRASGPPIGMCTVPSTGGAQSWTMVSCPLANSAAGKHDIYLVYHGTGKYLFSMEWFAFSSL